MDFTREPIIETVITPREGCKLVVRSSKSAGQEEYFVDALEVVSFGNSFFLRSTEKPKAFLVPASDYEILEVREPRMALKNVGMERKIKIAGGREAGKVREPQPAKEVKETRPEEKEEPKDNRADKRRERRRSNRRRRGRGGKEFDQDEEGGSHETAQAGEPVHLPPPSVTDQTSIEEIRTTASLISSLLPPPSTLISEQIKRYKQDDLYKDAFFEERVKPEPSHPPAEQSSAEEQHVPSAEDEKTE